MLKIEGDIPFRKKVKFTDVCMAGWQEFPPSDTNFCKRRKF